LFKEILIASFGVLFFFNPEKVEKDNKMVKKINKRIIAG
jgi:hypothetical protein